MCTFNDLIYTHLDTLIIILLLLIFVALVALAYRSFKEKESTANGDEAQTIIDLNREIAAKDQEIKNLREINEGQEEKLRTQFENLATKILDNTTKKFTDQNKVNLNNILDPLGVKIKEFEKKVNDTYVKGTKERSTLAEQIKNLSELNIRMSKDAINLTKALKGDSKTQGDWGEFKLEMILEKAGLMNGVHYSTQGSFQDEEGKHKRPDVIVNLPEGKCLVIDSKVSLTAYANYYQSEDDVEREGHLKDHVTSMKNHVQDLSSKNYQKLYQINAPDYVLMFVPIEPAFMLAIHADQDLMAWAVEKKNIVIVPTSTLLATISMVSSIWKQEDQKRNVLEIARQGGALYDKFVGFVDDLINVGKRLKSAKDSYDGAMNKLSTGKDNLVRKTENIKALGAKTSKSLPDSLIQRAITDDSGEASQADEAPPTIDEVAKEGDEL
ncbi:TPA: DNA recombination protein RmuC [Candidatus Poribacteria bacterium]|nr:DNA recombination protein RmuC [Candidatus Poribacteria bacterium]